MYSQEALQVIASRVGFRQALDNTGVIQIGESISSSESSMEVTNFHQLASVENIYSAVSVVNMEMDAFNAFLSSMRLKAAKSIINQILEKHEEYNPEIDYSDLLLEKKHLFDDALGFTLAVKVLELFVSSNRKNLTERNSSLSFQSLKIELEGAKNDRGYTVAKGIEYKRFKSIQEAKVLIFPQPTGITGSNNWS